MIGVEAGVDAGLMFPLVRLVEVLVDVVVLLWVVEEEEEASWDAELAAAGDEEEEEEEVCVVDVLGTPVGEGRMGREYVRRVEVEVSLGGAGTRMWGEGAPPAAAFVAWAAETDGAGVRGGGGEEVVGVSVGAGESRSIGLGVSLGGVGVAGVEESGVVVEV